MRVLFLENVDLETLCDSRQATGGSFSGVAGVCTNFFFFFSDFSNALFDREKSCLLTR